MYLHLSFGGTGIRSVINNALVMACPRPARMGYFSGRLPVCHLCPLVL